MSINIPKNIIKKNFTFRVQGVKKLHRYLSAAAKVKTEVGFVSKGKKNRIKTYFNIKHPAGRRVARSPVPIFLASKKLRMILRSINQRIADDAQEYAGFGKSPAQPGSPFPRIRKIWRPFYPLLAREFRKAATKTEPIRTHKAQHRSLIPLVETGKLLKSIRARNYFERKK